MLGENMNYKDRKEIETLVEAVKNFPIHYIIGTASLEKVNMTCEEALDVLNSGKSNDLIEIYDSNKKQITSIEEFFNYGFETYDALCPFHDDTRLGSYKINPQKGIQTCFVCGESGDAIKFEQEYYGLGFITAVYHLAYRLGLVNKNQAGEFKIDAKAKTRIKEIKENKEQKVKTKRNKIEVGPKTIHVIYEYLRDICGLSKRDMEHLKDDRIVNDVNMKDFFTFPEKKDESHIITLLVEKLTNRMLKNIHNKELEDLKARDYEKYEVKKIIDNAKRCIIYTPGFYYDRKEKRIRLAGRPGIAILCRDEKGLIQGIQIRVRKIENNEPRYTWLSSVFAEIDDRYLGGAGSNCPSGYVDNKKGNYVSDKNVDSLYITEGRFKAEALALNNCPVIYVSGVSTWKSIDNIYNNIKSDIKEINIAFDSDMLGNENVYNQLKKLAKYVKSKRRDVNIIVWNQKLGKGYDDLVMNYPKEFRCLTRKIRFKRFDDVYNKVYNHLLKKYGVEKSRDLEGENKNKFNKEMQSLLEKIISN